MKNNSWSTPIDKLMLWRVNSWTKCDTKVSNLILRVHYDQLLILSDSKIIESFSMLHKIKGIYKEDVLILIVGISNQIRKLKFQITYNVTECIQKLGNHFPVVCHNKGQSINNVNFKYRSINDILKNAFGKEDNSNVCNIPPDFNNFVRLCLLDATFPQLVHETEKIIKNIKK